MQNPVRRLGNMKQVSDLQNQIDFLLKPNLQNGLESLKGVQFEDLIVVFMSQMIVCSDEDPNLRFHYNLLNSLKI